MYIVITARAVILSKQEYPSFREIQTDFDDYVSSLGPWSSEEIIDYLEFEYPDIVPQAKEQVEALVKSEQLEVMVQGLDEHQFSS